MFQPWIGRDFGRPDNALGGVRLLVLGESHYASKPEEIGTTGDADFTTRVVQELAIDGPHRFFTNLTQVIGGADERRLGQEVIEAIWRSLVFYNYCPVFVGDGPRQRPTGEMFAAGAEPFRRLLSDLAIDAVLVCGYATWRNVLAGVAAPGDAHRAPFHTLDGVPLARMKHPSAGYNWRTWRPTVEALIALAPKRAITALVVQEASALMPAVADVSIVGEDHHRKGLFGRTIGGLGAGAKAVAEGAGKGRDAVAAVVIAAVGVAGPAILKVLRASGGTAHGLIKDPVRQRFVVEALHKAALLNPLTAVPARVIPKLVFVAVAMGMIGIIASALGKISDEEVDAADESIIA